MDVDENDLNEIIQKRLEKAILLKDYAISNNLDVSDDTLEKINHLLIDRSPEHIEERSYMLDQCIRDLTEVTYPTTINTVNIEGGKFSSKGNRFLWILATVGIFVLGISIFCLNELQETSEPMLYTSVLAAALGTLGALIYIFFNLLGILSESAFSEEDVYANTLRLVIGAIIGWIFYFVFVPDLAVKVKESNILSLLPFLGGFSTKLVVGIITQALKAVELTLGLEDKSIDLQKRKSRSRRGERIPKETVREITKTLPTND